MTKIERLRRLRILATMARSATHLPPNVRVEVGSRYIPVQVTDHVPTAGEAYPDGDDLADFYSMADATKHDDITGDGMIVHLYLSTTGAWGELQSVCTGWMGTQDHDPVLLDTDGTPVTR